MTHVLVPRELLANALIEFDGLDVVAYVRSMNKLRALLDAPCVQVKQEQYCPHGANVYDYCRLCEIEVKEHFGKTP